MKFYLLPSLSLLNLNNYINKKVVIYKFIRRLIPNTQSLEQVPLYSLFFYSKHLFLYYLTVFPKKPMN